MNTIQITLKLNSQEYSMLNTFKKKHTFILSNGDEEEMKDITFMEKMEEQEEHIKEAQNMEEHQEELLHKMEEEEMHIQQKTPSQDNDGFMKKIMDNI